MVLAACFVMGLVPMLGVSARGDPLPVDHRRPVPSIYPDGPRIRAPLGRPAGDLAPGGNAMGTGGREPGGADHGDDQLRRSIARPIGG